MSRTLWPCSESATPRFRVVVVFATPPFWFAKAMTLATIGPLPFFTRVFGRGSRRASPMASSFLATLAESFRDTAHGYGTLGRHLPRRRPRALRIGLRRSVAWRFAAVRFERRHRRRVGQRPLGRYVVRPGRRPPGLHSRAPLRTSHHVA